MSNIASKLIAITEASRPLLWLFSITSAFSGMFMAFDGLPPLNTLLLVAIGVGPCITAALNLLNAVYDVEVDRISKPQRPLPTNRISKNLTLTTAILLYCVGVLIAYTLGFVPFIITLAGIILSIVYSIPPTRIKAKGGFSNILLSLGYTTICFMGGWSIFRHLTEIPLLILVFVTLQVAGANVAKDFVDYEGDKEMGIGTLPVRYGIKNTLKLIAPCLVGIYFAIPIFYFSGYFNGLFLPITVFSIWGIYIIKSLNDDFSRKNREKAFLHAFLMSLFTEIAFTVAYVLS